MWSAYIHLIFSHIPVLFIPLGFIILAWGLQKQDQSIKNVGLIIIICGSLFAIPVFLMGERAKKIVENKHDVSAQMIEEHEEATDVAFPIILLTGTLAMLVLVFRKNKEMVHKLILATALVAIVGSGIIFRTANLGGKISHSELRTDNEKNLSRDTAKKKEHVKGDHD
ncbi:MAG: hypothetical protein HYV97_11885 [Bdellovibrio sp.]|nr:hypothetical protein [Bdellovibrio sp.]